MNILKLPFSPKDLLEQKKVSPLSCGNATNRFEKFSLQLLIPTGITLRYFTGPLPSTYLWIMCTHHKITSNFYNENITVQLDIDNERSSINIIPISYRLAEPIEYKITYFLPITTEIGYTVTNNTLFDVEINFEFDVIYVSRNFYEDDYKVITKHEFDFLNRIVELEGGKPR